MTTIVPVLLYHRVSDDHADDRFAVSRERFRGHVRAIRASGRAPVTMSELAGALKGERELPERAVAITFDDGYADTPLAARYLHEHELTSTVYVTTGEIGRGDAISAAQLAKLAEEIDSIELGAHTVSHPRLDEIGTDWARREIVESKRVVEAIAGRAIETFAYPHGAYDERVRSLVMTAGYSCAAAVKNALSHIHDDPWAIARWTVMRDTPAATVAALLDGDVAPLAWSGERTRTRVYRVARRARRRLLDRAPHPDPSSAPPGLSEAPVVDAADAPVAVMSCDVAQSEPRCETVGRDIGVEYRKAAVLIRRGPTPLGWISVDAGAGGTRVLDGVAATLPRTLPGGLGDAPEPAHVSERELVSVVLATTNRPPAAVACVGEVLRHANGAFEVIVVENRPAGSEVEQSLRAAFGDRPEVRYVEQVQPGLSSARNAGLAAARGRYVAFIDDDITVDEYWMRSIRAAFASSRDLACLTGPILPSELHTEGQILLEQFAAFSKGLTRRRFNTASGQEIPLFPYAAGHFGSGANMVFRADVLRRIGGFDVHLGTGTSARGGEDLDICVRLIQAGETIMYEPDAIVWHRHPETLRSLRRQALGYGVGLGAMLTKHLVAGEDRLALVRMIPAGARYLVSRGSRKNAFKRAEFPASLTRIERLGLLWGPAAYLLSRSAGFRPVDVGAATGPGESSGSVWSGQVEWTDPKLPGGSLRTDAGDPFDHARLLVRVDGEPLGFVQIDLRDGELEPAAVRAEVERAFGPIPVAAGIASLACPERPAATVVLCTRNRPDGAERCVRALLAADCPRLELIVVDNAPSDDATERLIRRLAVDDPRVRYVCEPRPGLSVARNRGLREATGEIIAFTDDDVRVDAHWLKGLERGFARRPDVGCVTGLVASSSLQRPAERFFDERVWWSSGCEQRLYDLRGAAAAHGTAERSQLFPYAAGVFGTGANMAFRTAVLEQLGGFDECLGTGSPTGGGEDLDIFVRLLHAGWSISYEPAALVWHDHRVDMDELEKQMFGYGKGLAAYLCKYLFSRSCAVDVLTRAARGVWHLLVLGRRSRSAGDRAGFGVELQRAEWRGLVAGGPAYLRARRQSSPEHLRRVAPSKRVRARSGALGLR